MHGLNPDDMRTLKRAFDDPEPERRVTSMVGSVVGSVAACVDALAAFNVDLANRWNDSADLLDRVEIGVDGLRRAADRHAALLALAGGRARGVMQVLGQSAEDASDDVDDQRPEMVERMEALSAVLASRTATLQDQANGALNDWAGILASQDPELYDLVAFSRQASAGMEKAITDAHTAVNDSVFGLGERLNVMGDTSSKQLEVIEEKVIAPAFTRWTAAVGGLPRLVEQAVTALLAELTTPATEAGTQVAQGATEVQELAAALSTRMGPVLQERGQCRGRIDGATPDLARQRDTLPVTVALCRETAETLGEPW